MFLMESAHWRYVGTTSNIWWNPNKADHSVWKSPKMSPSKFLVKKFSNTVYLRNEMWSFSLITISLFPRSTILQMYNHHSLFFVKVLARARVTHTLYRTHAILLHARPYVFFNLEQIFRRFFKSIPWTKKVDLISLRILIRARSQDRR